MKKIITALLNRFIESNALNTYLLKGASGGFVVKAFGAVLGFLLHIMLTRALGANQYGIYMYVISWINFLSIIGILGFSTASTRYISEYIQNKEWLLLKGFIQFSRCIVFVFSLFIVLALVLVVSFLIEVDHTLMICFIIGAFSLPFLNLLGVHLAELLAIRKVITSLIPKNIMKQSLMILGVLIVTHFLKDYTLDSIAVMVLDLLAVIICYVFSKVTFNKSFKQDLAPFSAEYTKKEWLLTSKDMLLISGLNLLVFQADQIILGLLTNTYQVGIYAVISKISLVVIFILSAVNSSLASVIAGLYADGEIDKLQKIITKGANISFVTSVFILVIVFVLKEQILSLFGQEFIVGGTSLIVLMVGQLANSYAGPTILTLNMTGFQSKSAMVLGVSVFANVVMNVILIPNYGFLGAAIATTLTMFLWNAMGVYQVNKLLSIYTVAKF